MTDYERSQRAPDLKALGLAVFAGVLLAQSEKMTDGWRLSLAAIAVGCYAAGVKWE